MKKILKTVSLFCLSLLLWSCGESVDVTETNLLIKKDGKVLAITPNSERSVRVQFYDEKAQLSDTSYIFTEKFSTPKFEVDQSGGNITMSLSELKVVYSKKSGSLSYFNPSGELILEEKEGGRELESSQIHGEPTFAVAQSFNSPKDERIFGTGQFQDGFLNVRDLPRRLTQVNTQISLPYIYSSKGYGLLWHNYGLTDFNPADSCVVFTAGTSGKAQKVKVTTAEGEEIEERRDGSFTATVNIPESGEYNLMLDVGQTMARRYYVEIDGKKVVDFRNTWLPPTTSWRMTLKEGEHKLLVRGEKQDNPKLFYRIAGDKTLFRSPVAEALDYTVIAGSADEAIDIYRDLSGRAPLMPKWAFGFIHCRERYMNQDQLLRNAKEFRDRKIPIDMIVQDWNYWDGRNNSWNCLQFDSTRYPHPKEMVDEVHDMNMKLMISVWPRMRLGAHTKAYKELKDCFIPNTMWIDAFNPKFQEIYGDNIHKHLGVMGIDGWWLDGSEPQDDALVNEKIYFGAGEKMRISYPLFVNSAVHKAMRKNEPEKRPFLFTRSAFLGQQRYGSTSWSGDVGNGWETLKRQVHAGLNFCISGIPYWTFDAGGFFRPGGGQYTDKAYHERFLRWLQFATLAPLQRVHGFVTKTEIWRFGDLVLNESVKLINLRYRLLPYIYSEAANVTYNNSTLMRALVMDFPEDEKALDVQYQYMFGPNMLVAPVLEPNVKKWSLYLPKNSTGWVDFWNGERYDGGQTISRPTTISEIPVFVKAGSIIPTGELQQYSNEKKNPIINLRVYTGGDATYTLYEDEGDNNNYEKGKSSTIAIKWDDKRKELTIGAVKGNFDGMAKDRIFRVTIMDSEKGAGLNEDEYFDAEINYSGKEATCKL